MKLIKEGEKRMMAMQLLLNANPDKYGSLIESYDRDFLSGENKYPKKTPDAYNLLKGWNTHHNPRGPKKLDYPSTIVGRKMVQPSRMMVPK